MSRSLVPIPEGADPSNLKPTIDALTHNVRTMAGQQKNSEALPELSAGASLQDVIDQLNRIVRRLS